MSLQWIEAQLANMNFRMLLIFLPALLNGQWSNMSFYSPFLFGQVLSACRAELFYLTASRALRFKTASAVAQVFGFIGFVTYFEAEGRYLSSFFFSSFLCPAIRHYAPEKGDRYVYALVAVGLIGAWMYQGLDHLFFGIFFLQGVPEVQRQLWFQPVKNFSLISFIFLITAPFTTLGTIAYWRPEWLQSFPLSYLEMLCVLMGVTVKDYHGVLGVPRDASKEVIGRQYRKMTLQCHPDKIPISATAAERAALETQFHEISQAQDMLNRPRNEGAKELNEPVPRCAACAFLCLYWVMHMMMDYLEIQQSMIQNETKLRTHLRSEAPDKRPYAHSIINLKALGLEGRGDEFVDYLEGDNKFEALPQCRENNLDDIKEMRCYLRQAGLKLDPLPKDLPETEPLIRQPQPQPQQQQVPGWVTWLQQPEQQNNILAMSFKGDIDQVKAALHGAGGPPQAPHATIQPGRRSCVFLAAMQGHAHVIEVLHQAGADVRLPDEEGFSPLHVASAQGHEDAVKCLLHCRADATQITSTNVSPLHTAAISGSVPIIKLLLRAGGKPKEQDKQGETALFCAAKADKPEAITCLVKSKADLECINIKKMTALWIASACGNAGAVAALHKAGAATDQVCDGIEEPLNRKTAEEAAVICKKEAVVELLQQANKLRAEVEVADRALQRAKEDKKPKELQAELTKGWVTCNTKINNLYKQHLSVPAATS